MSWIYAPIAGDLTVAEKGSGAFTNGRRLATRVSVDRPGIVGRHVAAELRAQVPWDVDVGTGASAFDYPELVHGKWSSILYWRTMPWDHVPGTLILMEAGGHAARLDGAPYRVGDDRVGLLAAPSLVRWRELQGRLPDELTAAGSDNR